MRDLGINIIGGVIVLILGAVAAVVWDQILRPLFEAAPFVFVGYTIIVLLAGVIAGVIIGRAWRNSQAKKEHGEWEKERKDLENDHNAQLSSMEKSHAAQVSEMESAHVKALSDIDGLFGMPVREAAAKLKELTNIEEAEQKQRAREKEEHDVKLDCLSKRIWSLPPKYKWALYQAVTNQIATLKTKDSSIGESLEEDGLLIPLKSGKMFSKSWKASPLAFEILDEESDMDLWTEVENGASVAQQEWLREKLDGQSAAFSALSFNQKLFIYGAYTSDGICADEWAVRDYDSGFLDREDKGGGEFRYTVKQEYSDLFEMRGDALFQPLRDWVEQNKDAEDGC